MIYDPKISVSEEELARRIWSLWLRSEMYRFFGRDGPMRIIDATWTPQVNKLLIRCGCGAEFQHRADRWTVRCSECFLEENLREVRERYRNERETEMAAKQQQQQQGLAPSIFEKYMAPMEGAWESGKAKAKEGTKALGVGSFFCRVTKLYFKEAEIKRDGKVVAKCLGAVAKLVVALYDNSGSICWKDWKFYTDENKTAEERFQDFQKDLVKMGLDNIDSMTRQQLPAAFEELVKRTPGVKISRIYNKQGAKDQNGNVFINTFLDGYVDEHTMVAMGAIPAKNYNGSDNMGGATIEEPSDISEPMEPELAHVPGEAPAPAAPATTKTRSRTAAAAPQAPAPAAPAATARPPRGQPEPVELDAPEGEVDLGGSSEAEPDLGGSNEPEPPLEDTPAVIDTGKTVQFKHPKTGAPMIGTVKGRHSSNAGWLVKDNNSTNIFAIKDDNPDLKVAD